MNKRSLKSQLPNWDRLLPQEQRWLSAMLNNNNRKRLAVNFDRKIVKWFIARHNTNVFVYLKRGCKILAPDQSSSHVISNGRSWGKCQTRKRDYEKGNRNRIALAEKRQKRKVKAKRKW